MPQHDRDRAGGYPLCTDCRVMQVFAPQRLRPIRRRQEQETSEWLINCRADVVGFHFLDADTAWFLPLFRLQQWAFGIGGQAGRIYDFLDRRRRRYVQRNDSWGRIVPVEVLAQEVGIKRAGRRQLGLPGLD